jgi:glycosyltransferase involved in cell wall biosynthesis
VDRRDAEPAPRPGSADAKLGDIAAAAGLRRIHLLAWRDLDDPEAGGSEIHAHMIASRWARAGLDVTMRTSFAASHPQVGRRDGYRVIRKAGRYLVFPRAALAERVGWHGPADGLVEIWNGMPFFSPLWATGPRVVFLHHLHAEMWDMTLPPNLARVGRVVEARLAPPLYRRTNIVTLSESSKRELVDEMGFRAGRIRVVHPGVDPRFSPGEADAARPTVLAVGRLVPVKRFHLLIDALATLKERIPDLEAYLVGEGYEREQLEGRLRALDAEDWLHLVGRVDDDELLDLYRRAWVLASASAREGWGMTITEAAACGTPAVVTDIAGHRDAVLDGRSGLLVQHPDQLADALGRVLTDRALRSQLGAGALARAAECSWDATAVGTLEALAADAVRRRPA